MNNKRKSASGEWIIRVYGQLDFPIASKELCIRLVSYNVWIEFVRDALSKSTSFMVYDGRNVSKANEPRRLQRLSNISKERGILWAYIEEDNQSFQGSWKDYPEGCLLRFGESNYETAQLMLQNAYEISTYAEKLLLKGCLVEHIDERKILQELHRNWRLQFASLQRSYETLSPTRDIALKQATQGMMEHLLEAIRHSISLAQVHGFTLETLNDLFIKYTKQDLPTRLGQVFQCWLKDNQTKTSANSALQNK